MKLIKSTIQFSRPMVFLCGPYYDEKVYDRRKILRDFINSCNNIIPIIIDKFLDKKNIGDDSVIINLIEEICAAVSFKTYIFLDTFSSVAELGMFCSGVYQNQIDVFIPKQTDIISNNIGFFVREIIENGNNKNIKCLNYRPRVVRVPLASEHVTEFFEFTKNELPKNIKERIINDDVYNIKNHDIIFKNGTNNTEEDGTIAYHQSDSRIIFYVSVRMLFYLVASILLEKKELNDIPVNEIIRELKELLKNSFYNVNKDKLYFDEVTINTKLIYDIDVIIKHMLVFIKLYYSHGDSKGRQIITKEDSFIRTINSYEYFDISSLNRNLINEYLNSPDNYIEIIKIKRGNKIRSITKYKDDENGNKLRQLHQLILNKLEHTYCFSDNSYAYRKGRSILDCVMPHKNSTSFLKIDIKSFFSSIKYMELYNYSKAILQDFFVVDRDYKNLLKSCMHNNALPLGLITSPILSDIYLHEFDRIINNLLDDWNKKIIFTRYADDMFFSCAEDMNNDDSDYIINSITEELRKINLKINNEKTVYKKLENFGDHVKILGLNIIKTKTKNELTVGKKFINDTCKMYLEYLKNKNNSEGSEKTKYYTEKRLIGRVAYIKQIEGLAGFEKFSKRIYKGTNHIVQMPDHKKELNYLMELKTEPAATSDKPLREC